MLVLDVADDADDADDGTLVPGGGPSDVAREDDLPVVARLVVEIRSDGSRTVARGALEDLASGQRAAVRVEGTSPLALSWQLARALVSLPGLARQRLSSRPSLRTAIRGALARRRRD